MNDQRSTTERATVTWSGWELTGREAMLEQLDRDGVTLGHEVVVCDHVTLAYPDTSRPVPVHAAVVGVASDADIQALVVEIDGRHIRPDGNIYHVTLSRRPDVPDWASKAMLLRAFDEGGVTWLVPWAFPTTPILRGAGE